MTPPLSTSPGKLVIVHVATHEGVYRGGAVQLTRMAVEQRRRGYAVTVVAHVSSKAPADERRMHEETWAGLRRAGVEVALFNYSTWLGRRRLRRLLTERNADLVHAHRDRALVACAKALRGRVRPVLVAQRGTIKPPPAAALAAFRAPQTRAVIAVADAVADVMKRALGDEAGKVRRVYGSVDVAAFAPRPPDAALIAELNLPPGARVIGSLSAWRRAKRLEHLIDVLGKVMGDRPDAYAVFLGKGVTEYLRPRAIKRGIEGRCRFVDHQPDVARWLSIMEMTVVTASDREGLSGVLRESLAMEVPVISTDCAGNREIVRDGETGLLAPIGDKAALAAALRRALDDPAAMQAMARAGRQWVLENCSLETQADNLETIYRSLL
jgi:glycosyltransferase involved in cell wall biosynthesis